ncbi:FAD-dependent oxidoreductase [uncultured Sulfitobacter sp.]|uniref:NAD(P)/FAD-dependent oxidoreductase n=1 Tax=uncultured Sulfitobacter sp. TaxID=191468 RepID=UPI0026321026|nr:FAD-dependent oxidoreductase [uncultured Sulfitobacter sp.]
MSGVVIIGAGHAGVQLAASLRDAGYTPDIRLLSADPDFPYHKPPLSKSFMATEDAALQPLRGEAFFAQNNIELSLGVDVAKIDRAGKSVICADCETIAYDKLVIATGTSARKITVPGADLPQVYALRTAGDARAMRDALPAMKNVVVIGGGFIGLEAAAMLSARGVQVDVVEMAPRLLGRATSESVAEAVADHLIKAGVRLHLNQSVKRITAQDGAVCGVQLGEKFLAADHVLVGIGAVPMDQLATNAGLSTNNGVVVDAFLATDDPDIFAIGDCVSFPQVHLEAQTRLESVQNATDQARALALTLTGTPKPYTALPWFWSDVGTLKLQIAGLSDKADQLIETHDAGGALKSVYLLKQGKLIACETLNSAAEHMLSRRMIAEGFTPDIDLMAGGDAKALKLAYQRALKG